LNVAIEHRLMHAETLAYMLHRLPIDRKIAPSGYVSIASAAPARSLSERMIDIPPAARRSALRAIGLAGQRV